MLFLGERDASMHTTLCVLEKCRWLKIFNNSASYTNLRKKSNTKWRYSYGGKYKENQHWYIL